MSRPPWLAEVIAAFGQPETAFSGPVGIGGAVQCRSWSWFVSGEHHNVAVLRIPEDRYEVSAAGPWVLVGVERYEASASRPGRTAGLQMHTEPTDDDIRAVCAAAWPALRPRQHAGEPNSVPQGAE